MDRYVAFMLAVMSRRSVMLLGAALLAAACVDKTPDVVAPPSASVTNEVEGVARAIALGMTQAQARHAVRDAMRASPLTEHKLLFQQYAASAAAAPLLQAAAAATGITLIELRARIAALPDLDFYVASEQQRLSWRGGSDYLVSWRLGGAASRIAYDGNGATRAFDATKPRPPEAVFFLESAERTSVRLDRQPDVPGLTIQDPGDGQLSGSWVTIDRNGTTRTTHLADLVHSGGPMGVSCLEDCGGGSGGGGSGGGGTPPPPSPPTYLNQIKTFHVCDYDDCGNQNEFDFRALKSDGTTEVLQLEGVPTTGTLILNRRLINALPPMLVGGECITSYYSCGIAARERDWPDGDDWWFFHYRDARGYEQCAGIPLGSNVAHYEAGSVVARPLGASDEYRLFTLQEDETCQSDFFPDDPLNVGRDWRLKVSFWWATSPVASVTVTPASPTIRSGETVALSATPRDAQGNVITGRTVTWTSSPTTVATVNAGSGVVSGVGGGQATIRATIDGVSGTTTVTVLAVATVTIAPPSATVCVNGTITLTATAKDQQGNVVTTGNAAWVSNNTSAATVTQAGSRTASVTGVGSGQATVTGTLSGISGTSTVTAGTCLPPPTNCQIQYIAGPKYLQVTWANTDPAASTEVEINSNGAWSYAGTASPGVTQYFYVLGSQTGLFYGRVRHVKSGYLPGGYCTTGSTTAP